MGAKISWNGNKVNNLVDKGVRNSLIALGLAVEQKAVDLTPVDTGRLKGSITVKSKEFATSPRTPAEESDTIKKPKEDNTVLVGTNVRYAEAVELGIGQNAQPYLKPAMYEVDSKKDKIIAAQLIAQLKTFLE